MAMTGSQFYDYIVRTFKREDKTTEIYEATTDVINYIRETYAFEDFKEVKDNSDIDSLGEYTFSLPADFDHLIGEIKVLYSSGSRQLITITKEEYDRIFPYPDDTNVTKALPKFACVYGGNVFLGDVPDSTDYVYEFNYAARMTTPIVSGTTSVPFTDHNRLMLKHLVLGQLFSDLGDAEEASSHQSIGNDLLSVLVNKEKDNTEGVNIVSFRDV